VELCRRVAHFDPTAGATCGQLKTGKQRDAAHVAVRERADVADHRPRVVDRESRTHAVAQPGDLGFLGLRLDEDVGRTRRAPRRRLRPIVRLAQWRFPQVISTKETGRPAKTHLATLTAR
jgi:alkylation response protein AidB-like acyl-CoA dehydrogenase